MGMVHIKLKGTGLVLVSLLGNVENVDCFHLQPKDPGHVWLGYIGMLWHRQLSAHLPRYPVQPGLNTGPPPINQGFNRVKPAKPEKVKYILGMIEPHILIDGNMLFIELLL